MDLPDVVDLFALATVFDGRVRGATEQETVMMASQWWELIGHLPPDLVIEATRDYYRSNKWPITPADIIERVKVEPDPYTVNDITAIRMIEQARLEKGK